MVFDVLAVLILTFFASLGMVHLTQWLLSHSNGKKPERKIFVVAKINSVPVSDLEDGIRSLLAESDLSGRELLLDGEDALPEALALCRNLEKRFGVLLFQNEKELLSFLVSGLQGKEKQV